MDERSSTADPAALVTVDERLRARLKELGLTLSLDVGYRLSPRGESYLNCLRPR